MNFRTKPEAQNYLGWHSLVSQTRWCELPSARREHSQTGEIPVRPGSFGKQLRVFHFAVAIHIEFYLNGNLVCGAMAHLGRNVGGSLANGRWRHEVSPLVAPPDERKLAEESPTMGLRQSID